MIGKFHNILIGIGCRKSQENIFNSRIFDGKLLTNSKKLAFKFDLNKSECKSLEVNASAHKAWPNRVAVFNLAST